MLTGVDAELQAESLLDRLYNEAIPKGEIRRRWFQLVAEEQATEQVKRSAPARLGRFIRRLGRSREQAATGLPGELAM